MPLALQLAHGRQDVAGAHGDVLHARSHVVVQVFLDLALALALGRLVDGELDPPAAVLHHLGHQGRVLGADVLVVEVQQLAEAHHLVVEVDPVVHLAQLHVAHHVIDRRPARSTGPAGPAACRSAQTARGSRCGPRRRAAPRRRCGWPMCAGRRARRLPRAAPRRSCRRGRVVSRQACSTSSTVSAMTLTPSPWTNWCAAISLLGP